MSLTEIRRALNLQTPQALDAYEPVALTPAELETRLTTRTLLDSVLPANRKAKLWDLYEQRYSEISREAEDDFHSLFGREFLKAYEAQIAQLQRGRE